MLPEFRESGDPTERAQEGGGWVGGWVGGGLWCYVFVGILGLQLGLGGGNLGGKFGVFGIKNGILTWLHVVEGRIFAWPTGDGWFRVIVSIHGLLPDAGIFTSQRLVFEVGN